MTRAQRKVGRIDTTIASSLYSLPASPGNINYTAWNSPSVTVYTIAMTPCASCSTAMVVTKQRSDIRSSDPSEYSGRAGGDQLAGQSMALIAFSVLMCRKAVNRSMVEVRGWLGFKFRWDQGLGLDWGNYIGLA